MGILGPLKAAGGTFERWPQWGVRVLSPMLASPMCGRVCDLFLYVDLHSQRSVWVLSIRGSSTLYDGSVGRRFVRLRGQLA